MKTKILSAFVLPISASCLIAQPSAPKTVSPAPPPPPPVSAAQPPSPTATDRFVYDHKPKSDLPYLVTPEQAQTVITRFKEAYSKMGNPRMVIYVNRDLVDSSTGLKLSARTEQTEASRGHLNGHTPVSGSGTANQKGQSGTAGTGGAIPSGDLNKALQQASSGSGNASGETEKVTAKNNYRVREAQPATLADRQTVRDVERLFGHPLRMAGVTLVDQRIATQLIGDKSLSQFTVATESEVARKDREALSKNADVVLEILISSRQVTVPAASGDQVFSVPDIQATAIRLKDSKIVGQVSASDLIGHNQAAGRVAQNFGVREISEATALALMEDMTQWP